MNSQRPSSGSSKKERQGPRPPPLKICRESQKIRKPVPAVQAVPSMPIINRSQPMIIYTQSPKIIHAEVQDFMTLVQRLTGNSLSSSETRNSDNSENLKANHESTIHQASAATTSHQPAAASVESMGMSYTDSTVNTNSWCTTEIDRKQKNGIRVSEPEANEHGLSAATSASILATTSALSPFSPNFLLPSPRLNFSPSVLKGLPLMTPNSDYFFCNSPREFYRISEQLFSPYTPFTMIQSPSLTAIDLYKMNPEY